MPRERVHHGKLFASFPIVQAGSDEPTTPTGIAYKEYFPGDDTIPADAKITEEPSLDVTWNRDAGWVQVSIDMSREKWITNAQELEESPETIKRAIYTDVLTRKEINDMIHVLRRARDAAYGKDA